jgi:hypothetical protein
MMGIGGRLLAALALILPLSACILTPAKFTSTLDIGKDHSFTFTYVGEVIAPPLPSSDKSDSAEGSKTASTNEKPADILEKPESASTRERMIALADSLSKEHGYRSVKYLGNYHFAIDYAISGKLTHNFVYPFNMDGEVIVPFIAIELRGTDRVRLKAPGYANDESRGGGDMASALGGSTGANAPSELDGTFTLTTDGEIISQNQESGATTLPNGRKRIVWTATPRTKDAPTASLKLDALP